MNIMTEGRPLTNPSTIIDDVTAPGSEGSEGRNIAVGLEERRESLVGPDAPEGPTAETTEGNLPETAAVDEGRRTVDEMSLADDSALDAAKVAYIGYFDGIVEDTVLGWVWNPADPTERVVVELWIDGRAVVQAVANLERSDLVDAGYGDGWNAFALRLPELAPDGMDHGIEVVIAGTDHRLSGSPKIHASPEPKLHPTLVPADEQEHDDATAPDTVEASPYVGSFEAVAGGLATGWAFDPRDPSDRLTLEMRVDDRPTMLFSADSDRRDVARAGFGDGRSGFSTRLPQAVYDGQPHSLSIVVAGTGHALPGGPHTIQVSRVGVAFLDAVQASVRGWATQGPDIAVRFDEGPPAVLTASLPVVGFGGASVPAAACGFSVPIPASYLDGTWHTASVRFQADDTDLPGSPFGFRLSTPGVHITIDSLDGLVIRGSAADPRQPQTPVALFAFLDGVFYGKTIASQRRARDGVDGDTRRADGFAFTLPREARRLDLCASPNREADILASFDIDLQGKLIAALPDSKAYLPSDLSDEVSIQRIEAGFAAFCVDPGHAFDETWYLQTYPSAVRDIASGRFSSALDHYRAVGRELVLSPSPWFDEAWYRRRWTGVEKAVLNGSIPSGFAHYLSIGREIGLDPVPGFVGDDYAEAEPDVAKALAAGVVLDPLDHWIRTGSTSAYDPGGPSQTSAGGTSPQRIETTAAPTAIVPGLAKSIYATWITRLMADAADARSGAILSESDLAATRFVLEVGLPDRPLVSIIMPTFNRAYTIGEAIQSVLDQTYGNWELLVCDDGSVDKTALVVAQFDDPRIRYMHFEKSNGAETRNKGLSLARGEYIAYLDSDNIWHPLYLDVMLRELLRSPSWPCAYCGYIDTEIVGTKIVLNAFSAPSFNPVRFTERNFIDLNTICHHRNLFDWLGGFDDHLPRLQDWDMTLRYLSIFKPIAVPHYLAYYRRNVAWGQVTHLFADQDIASLVHAKTSLRVNLDHVRLNIPSAVRPSLVLVAGASTDAVLLATLLARQVSDLADITLLCPAVDDQRDKLPDGVLCVPVRHTSFANANALASAILPFLSDGTVVLTAGLTPAALDGLKARLPLDVDAIDVDADGLVLRSGRCVRPFQLGTLPLPIGSVAAEEKVVLPAGVDQVVVLLSGSTNRRPSPADVMQWLKKFSSVAVVLPPADALSGSWLLIHAQGEDQWTVDGIEAVARAFSMADTVACLTDLENLSPVNFLVAAEAMARGKIMMVLPSIFTRPLIDGRVCYEIKNSDGPWIIDKVKRLAKPSRDAERFSKNVSKTYKISFHPELAHERLRFYLHVRSSGKGC